VKKEKRKALALLDGIAGGKGVEAIVSFPGMFQDEWNEIVAMADLLKRLDPDNAFFSTACIFLPDGDANFGKHCDNDVDNDGKCFCFKLYGEKKDWGCKWFDIWRNQLLEILRRGQVPVVVYKAGQVGQGDSANWDNFPIPFTTDRPGLGGSQAGEVALVKLHVGERFIKRDVKDVSKAIAKASFDLMDSIIQGVQGARKLAAAIESSHAAQQGLKSLVLVAANIGEAGARALAKQLPKLRALKVLHLDLNDLGEAGARALAEQLPKLPALKELYLYDNDLGEAEKELLRRAKPEQLFLDL